MAIDFPNSPTTGQQFTAGGATWTWDGSKWAPAASVGTGYLPLTGGIVTGNLGAQTFSAADGKSAPVSIADPPSGDSSKSLATTEWVLANARIGDNRIINGDMRIDQRNNGASGTGTQVYTIDRWYYNAAQTAKGGWQRTASVLAGFPYQLVFSSSSAYVALAADWFHWQHAIEADFISDFAWGTTAAQPITLSFWVLTTQAGTFSGSIRNSTPNRSYVFTFSIPTANVWTRIVITIPGDTGGTWTLSGNGVGLYLSFNLGGGANYLTSTPNAWGNGNLTGAVGSVSTVAVSGATFQLTGVKLEIGSNATPFNHPPLAQALAACQRYYYQFTNFNIAGYYSPSGGINSTSIMYKTTMRAIPTGAIVGTPAYSNCSALSVVNTALDSFYASYTVTAAGPFSTFFGASFNAEL